MYVYYEINYKTKLSEMPLVELRKRVKEEKNDIEAKIELILRSEYAGHGKKEVSNKEAAQVSEEHLREALIKTHPDDHPVFYHIVGMHACNKKIPDNEKAKAYLLKAINKGEKFVGVAAAIGLAETCRCLKEYIESQAWLVKAILLGSERAMKAYLNARFFQSRPPIEQKCTFLAVLLSGKTFPGIEYSNWMRLWIIEDKKIFTNANNTNDPLNGLDNAASDVTQTAKTAIEDNPSVFYNFFTYCYKNNIVSDAVYSRSIDFLIHSTQDKKIKDEANYSLFKFYLAKKKFVKAKQYLSQLSTEFTDYEIRDYEQLPLFPLRRDKISYQIFKKLYTSGHYEKALLFLNNITACKVYDESAFQYFNDADPEAKDYELFKIRKDLARKVVHQSNDAHISDEVRQRAQNEHTELSKTSTEIRYLFRSAFASFETNKVKEKRKTIYVFLENLLKKIEDLSKDPAMSDQTTHSKAEYESLYLKLSKTISEGKKAVSLRKKQGKLNPQDKVRFNLQEIKETFVLVEEKLKVIQDLTTYIQPQLSFNNIIENRSVSPAPSAPSFSSSSSRSPSPSSLSLMATAADCNSCNSQFSETIHWLYPALPLDACTPVVVMVPPPSSDTTKQNSLSATKMDEAMPPPTTTYTVKTERLIDPLIDDLLTGQERQPAQEVKSTDLYPDLRDLNLNLNLIEFEQPSLSISQQSPRVNHSANHPASHSAFFAPSSSTTPASSATAVEDLNDRGNKTEEKRARAPQ